MQIPSLAEMPCNTSQDHIPEDVRFTRKTPEKGRIIRGCVDWRGPLVELYY